MQFHIPHVRNALMTLACGVMSMSSAHALTVATGFDFWKTTDGTKFNFNGMDIPLEGVSVGQFNLAAAATSFGVAPNLVGADPFDTKSADTIAVRKQDAVAAGGDTAAGIPIEIIALQLRSAGPVPLLGEVIYITLAPGRPSTGTMDISFDDKMEAAAANDGEKDGTWTSDFDLFFHVRTGGFNGAILDLDQDGVVDVNGTALFDPMAMGTSGDILQHTFLSSASPWYREFNSSIAPQIEGGNINLNGSNNFHDFMPGPVTHISPSGGVHATTTPVPATIALLGAGLAGLGLLRRKA